MHDTALWPCCSDTGVTNAGQSLSSRVPSASQSADYKRKATALRQGDYPRRSNLELGLPVVITGYTTSPGYCLLQGALRAARVLCPHGGPVLPAPAPRSWDTTCDGLQAAAPVLCVFAPSCPPCLAILGTQKALVRASCLPSGWASGSWPGRTRPGASSRNAKKCLFITL